jgi:nitronate monooxygenase
MTDDLPLKIPVQGLLAPFKRLRLPSFDWPTLRIGEKIARIPVIQGGMGVGISLSGLASAVANAGGIGTIAANAIGMIEKDYYKDGRSANLRALRREIRIARGRTQGLLGVNIMVAVNDFHELLDVAAEEKVDLVMMGAGLPVKGIPVKRLRLNGVKVVPIVSSARATEMIFRMWKKTYDDVPDAIVCEGPRAGGHLGFSEEQIDDPEYQLDTIVPRIIEALKPYENEYGRAIPVIAAGGIFTGDDVHAALKLGASAVQMATRFVATNECDADPAFKQAYVECTKDQIGLIKSPVGMPGRAIRNDFLAATEEGRQPSFRCAWQCLSSCKAEAARYCISVALNNARKGKLDKGFVFAGENAHRVTGIVPVQSLVDELAEGFRISARETVARKIEGLVARVQNLWREHDDLRLRSSELEKAYETAVADRIRYAGNAGVAKIRKSYDTVLRRLRDLQFQIAEGLADSWAALQKVAAVSASTNT